MKQKNLSKVFVISILTSLVISTFTAIAINVNIEKESDIKLENDYYGGHLRVYVIEPISRWDDYDGNPYHYGFLDFAVDEKLSIKYLGVYNKQVTWNSSEAGYENIEENNIMVIAAIFNPKGCYKFAFPPFAHLFKAYYVDAAAAATPGTTGFNTVNEDFTHTVFIEEGTATWCKACPKASENLYEIYESHDYPFYFVGLIGDMVEKADKRITEDYNIMGYPTCFVDGGYKVEVGSSSVDALRSLIEESGKRDVHEYGLSISLEWTGDGILDIEIEIRNNEETAKNINEIVRQKSRLFETILLKIFDKIPILERIIDLQ